MASPVRFLPALPMFPLLSACASEEFLTFGSMLALSLAFLRFLRASGAGSSRVGLFFSLLGRLGKSRLFWFLLLLSLPSLCAAVDPAAPRSWRNTLHAVALVFAGCGIFRPACTVTALTFAGLAGIIYDDLSFRESLLSLSFTFGELVYHISFVLPTIFEKYDDGNINPFSLLISLGPVFNYVAIFCLCAFIRGDSPARPLREHVTTAAQSLLLCCSVVLILFLF